MSKIKFTKLRLTKPRTRILAIILFSLFLVTLVILPEFNSAYSGGFTGGSSSGCSCHGSSDSIVNVEINGLPTDYTPNDTYTLTITVTDGSSGTTGGFDLEVNKGAFTNPGSNAKLNNDDEVLHSTSGSRTWTVDWIAPSPGSGGIKFNIAGIATNGDSGSSGDKWNTATQTVNEAGAAALIETSMTLYTLTEASQGDDIIISAIITDIDGNYLPDLSIEFYRTTSYGIIKIGESTSDSNGIANISHTVSYTAVNGSIDVLAVFQGTSDFEASSISEDIVVEIQELSQYDLGFTVILFIVFLLIGSAWTVLVYVLSLLYGILKESKT